MKNKLLFLPVSASLDGENAVGLSISYDEKEIVVKVILENTTGHKETFKRLEISKYNGSGKNYLVFTDSDEQKEKLKLVLRSDIDEKYLQKYIINMMK